MWSVKSSGEARGSLKDSRRSGRRADWLLAGRDWFDMATAEEVGLWLHRLEAKYLPASVGLGRSQIS